MGQEGSDGVRSRMNIDGVVTTMRLSQIGAVALCWEACAPTTPRLGGIWDTTADP